MNAPESTTEAPPRVDGRSERWREHRERRRSEFIDAAFRAIAEEGPDARMEQIAAAAGTAKPKLYRHFATKADLVDAIAERSMEMVIASLAGRIDLSASIRSAVSVGLDGYFEFVESNPNVVRFLMDNAMDTDGSQIMIERARSIARLFVAIASADLNGAHLPPAEVEPLAHVLVGAVLGATDWWTLQDPDNALPRERVVKQLTTVLTSAAEGALGDWGIELDLDSPGLLAALGFIPAAAD